jgi:hypothetical protein
MLLNVVLPTGLTSARGYFSARLASIAVAVPLWPAQAAIIQKSANAL